MIRRILVRRSSESFLADPGRKPGVHGGGCSTEGEGRCHGCGYRTPPINRCTGLMSMNMTAAAPSVTAAVTPNKVGSGVVLMNPADQPASLFPDRKSTRLNSSHRTISYAVFCLKKKKKKKKKKPNKKKIKI